MISSTARMGIYIARTTEQELCLSSLTESNSAIRSFAKEDLFSYSMGFSGTQTALLAGQTGMVVVQPRALERAERVYAPAHKAANADFLNRIRENGYRFSFDILEVLFDAHSLVVAG